MASIAPTLMELDLLYVGIVYLASAAPRASKSYRAAFARLAMLASRMICDSLSARMRMAEMARFDVHACAVEWLCPCGGVGSVRHGHARDCGCALALRMAWLCSAAFDSFSQTLPRQLFFTGGDHIKLWWTDAAAVHAGNFQTRVHAQGGYVWVKTSDGTPASSRAPRKHIAADTGKSTLGRQCA